MKEMEYKEKKTFEILDEGSYCGFNYMIVSLAYHPSEYFIIWDKVNPLEFSFAMCEQAWTSIKKPAKIFTYNSQNESTCRIHPTQKPVALYEWLLTHYAKHGDKILDTHLGSGSSRIAAYNLGFDFVGCEIDKDYFDAQEARFAAHTAQTSLFDGEGML